MIVYVHRSAPTLSWSRTRELLPSFWRHMPQRNRQNLSMVSWIQQQWVLTDGSCFFPFYLYTSPLLPHCSSYPLLPLTLFCPRFPSWSGTRGHANFQQDQSVSLQEMFKICRKLLHRTNRQGPSFFLDKDLRSSCSNDMSVEPQRFFFGLKKVGIFSFILRDKFVTS